jgi:hypothetical protein
MQQSGKMIKLNGLAHFSAMALLMSKARKCLNLKAILLLSLMLLNNMDPMLPD